MNATAEKTMHEGRNVKRIREILGIKQDTLASELGLSQQSISQLEQRETIDQELLERISAILNVPVEAIRNFDDRETINIISNTFNDDSQNIVSPKHCTFNPLEKLMEAIEENKKLYEKLLESEREKVAMLERMMGKG